MKYKIHTFRFKYMPGRVFIHFYYVTVCTLFSLFECKHFGVLNRICWVAFELFFHSRTIRVTSPLQQVVLLDQDLGHWSSYPGKPTIVLYLANIKCIKTSATQKMWQKSRQKLWSYRLNVSHINMPTALILYVD